MDDSELVNVDLERDGEMFECGVSREALILSEMSGSVSILPYKDLPDDDENENYSRKIWIIVIIVFLVFLLGVILLLIGLVMLSKVPVCESLSNKARFENMCHPSSEAKTSGLYSLLDKVQSFYFESFPNKIAYKRPVSVAEIRRKFRLYDESPAAKKNMTDRAVALLNEVNSLGINMLKLTLREAKALSQIKHSLKYAFGYAYGTNYYAGDYMLGPNLWCEWELICDIGYDLSKSLRYFKPNTTEDVELLRDKLMGVKEVFAEYIKNLKYGVRAGMVRTQNECKAGINGMTAKFKNIAYEGEQGVFKETYVKDILDVSFLSNFNENVDERDKWQLTYGKEVNESIREFVLEFIGKPIDNLFRYLREEHMSHCVPSTVSSGLVSLPLSYVYVNGTADKSQVTTKTLPTGEVLDGKKTYEMLVGSFTTNNMTADQIYNLGMKMLNELYPEIIKIAQTVTGQSDKQTAKDLFMLKLNSSEMFYNENPFPANESDENAYKLCSNVNDAKKHCPERWKAMEKWFADTSMFNSLLDPKTVTMFHFTGPKYSVPNCPLAVAPEFNPSAGANYNLGGTQCLKTARYNLPFFKSKIGPKWSLLTTCAHEGRPGHHTQAQGMLERFRDRCGGVVSWVDSLMFYTAFVEGWALYAENPLIAKETDVYDKRPLDKYGFLKWQVWRALRLVVDSGLHHKGMTRDKAIEFFIKFAWDDGEMAAKEVTRYQSAFGQATSYMIGQQHIIKLRDYAKKELGAGKFELKDFHYHLLSQGSTPLSHLDNVIKKYVSCTKNRDQDGCENILKPPRLPKEAAVDQGVDGDDPHYNSPQPRPGVCYF